MIFKLENKFILIKYPFDLFYALRSVSDFCLWKHLSDLENCKGWFFEKDAIIAASEPWFTRPGNHAAVLAFKDSPGTKSSDSSNLNDLNQPQHKIFVEAVCWLDQRHEEKEPQSKRTRWDAYWDSKNNYKEKSSWWEVLRLGIIFRWGSTSDLLSCIATLRFLSFHQYWARSQGWSHHCRYLNQPFK